MSEPHPAPVSAASPPMRAPRAEAATPHWVDLVFGDTDRARGAMLNQLVIAAVVLVLALVVLGSGAHLVAPVFFTGVVLIFLLTAASIMVPWNSVAPLWVAVLPLADIVGIAFMRAAEPAAGFGLLWAFPVLWLSSSFGLFGYISSIVFSLLCYAVSSIVEPRQSTTFSIILLPLLLVAIGTSAYLSSRRVEAQRRLLDRQAEVLVQSLERARRHEQVLTEALDRVDFGVAKIEADGSASIMNDAHARLQRDIRTTGERPLLFAVDGTTPLDPDEQPMARVRRGEAFEDQRIWVGEPGHARRAISVTARRIIEPNGQDGGAVVVTRDVTAETEALRARDALVSSVSHELRTPLTSILGYIELAIDTPGLPPSAVKSLEVADRNAERLLALVGDVLAASSGAGEQEAFAVTPRDIDLADVVTSAVESLSIAAGERGIEIDATGIRSVRAYADPLRTQQVLDNLLSNAVKYNRPGGSVTIEMSQGQDWAEISVRDTGVGLSEDDLGNLFQRYYRGVAVRKSGVAGSGLGLAISRDIVRRQGGDMVVTSALGVGSTFVVTLPAHRPGERTPTP
ncbi:sensor histidine kinase [Microbacterium terricola]|nr:HAMP domain-containing sensor histidine kinase [Microbacterium terricola]UYK38859.1 HAMP domain-containing histidine kinase [Microbacterium terricola]